MKIIDPMKPDKVQSLSHRHHAIARLMVLKPHLTNREIAKELGYTPTWVNMISRTHMFQTLLSELKGQHFENGSNVLNEEINGVASLGLEAMAEKLSGGASANLSLDEIAGATKLALEAAGYVNSKNITPASLQQVNNYNYGDVSAQEIQEARKGFGSAEVPQGSEAGSVGGELSIDAAVDKYISEKRSAREGIEIRGESSDGAGEDSGADVRAESVVQVLDAGVAQTEMVPAGRALIRYEGGKNTNS